MNRGVSYHNQALRLLVRRADRHLSLTIGLPDSASDTGAVSPIRGELKMIRAGLRCACADLYGVLSDGNPEQERASAVRFLQAVAPGLLVDKARIEAHLVRQGSL